MAPRRSSRALATQPVTGSQQTTHSSSSSTASGLAERHTRSHTKTTSPQKAATPRSRNSEEHQVAGSGPARPERLGARRATRHRASREDELDPEPVAAPAADDDPVAHDEADGDGDGNDDDGEEEVTRCVCGHLDYPGLPLPFVSELGQGPKHDADPSTASAVEDGAEPGSLFVQCDRCKVWQHGGCVGILSIGASDDYFCELCRPDLHRMHDEVKGSRQRYSRYLPHVIVDDGKPSPTQSIAKSTDTRSTRAKNGGATMTPQTGKRRSTMNSRDAAYDEEEQLRRAIEQSKAEKAAGRKGRAQQREAKRARSDSHDRPMQSAKRQRTDSNSATSASPSNVRNATSAVESGDEHPPERATTTTTAKTSKTLKGAAAARHQREKELREEAAERDKERAEAAGRRKGRADRRRAEGPSPLPSAVSGAATTGGGVTADVSADSEVPDDASGSRPGTAMSPPAATPRPMDAPPPPSRAGRSTTAQPPAPTSTVGTPSTRKTARVPLKRGKGGRNQYTRERELARESSTMTRSQSRDGPAREDHHPKTNGGPNGDAGKGHRARPTNPQRMTVVEMKRRVAAMLDFISRVQVEMASEKTPPTGGGGAVARTAAEDPAHESVGGELPKITLTGDGDAETAASNTSVPTVPEKDFNELGTVEMMDVLTRQLVLWQQKYGELTDK